MKVVKGHPVGSMREPLYFRATVHMHNAKETARLIRELADREGRNGMTVRFVDPQTLRKAA